VRILVAHNVDRRRTGGMSRIMELVHDQVAAAGHTVDWLCADDVPERWRGSRSRISFPWLVWHRARQAAAAGRPYDIVNAHEPHALPITLAQRSLTRFGVAVTSHGLERRAWDLALEERRLGRGGPGLRSRLVYPSTSLWQSRAALTRARFVFTLNEEDRDYLTTRFNVPRARVGRLRPGAADLFATPAGRRTYDSSTRLVFAGTWRENKGIADLVPAFTTLAARHPAMTLTVLGAGVEDSTVLNAFPAPVRSRVSVISAATDGEMVKVLEDGDIFVLPSLFEGTPLTLIEAMMSGLPVVTTSTCGMRDVVEDGRTGLLVPVRAPAAIAGAIDRLVGSRELRSSLGRAAHGYAAAHHTWRYVALEVLAAYEGIAAAPAG
jgi:glycosyltransferase involved in cell wall biosynthesis